MGMTLELAQATEIDHETCLALLASQQVGRLAWGGSPLRMRPVNYVAVGGAIYFRTALDLPDRAAVIFEVDQIDAHGHQGWSVILDGHVEPVRMDDDQSGALECLSPWPPVEQPLLIKVVIDVVSGRCVRGSRELADTDAHGYL